jgi:hypothetical protein
MARTKRARKTTKERQIVVGSVGVPFVEEGGTVHGTPSDTNRASKRGAYAASSVIKRGTANVLRADLDEETEHVCVCGCGQTPSNADSLFMPGHDSKVRSMGKAINEGRLDKKKVPDIALNYLVKGGMIEAR